MTMLYFSDNGIFTFKDDAIKIPRGAQKQCYASVCIFFFFSSLNGKLISKEMT